MREIVDKVKVIQGAEYTKIFRIVEARSFHPLGSNSLNMQMNKEEIEWKAVVK